MYWVNLHSVFDGGKERTRKQGEEGGKEERDKASHHTQEGNYKHDHMSMQRQVIL